MKQWIDMYLNNHYEVKMEREARNYEREIGILGKMGPKTQVFYIIAKEIIAPIGFNALLIYWMFQLCLTMQMNFR